MGYYIKVCSGCQCIDKSFIFYIVLYSAMEKYYTTKEVSSLMKVQEVTVRRWIKSGKLPAIRFGREYRLKLNDLEKYGKLNILKKK